MSHPKNWFEDQVECHKLINNYFALTALTQIEFVQEPVQQEVQEPTNQLNIFDVIEEVEEAPKLTSPTDVIEDDLSLLVQEEIQEEVVEETVEFFNFGVEELPTFELPDL
jgi:hypothetical protein